MSFAIGPFWHLRIEGRHIWSVRSWPDSLPNRSWAGQDPFGGTARETRGNQSGHTSRLDSWGSGCYTSLVDPARRQALESRAEEIRTMQLGIALELLAHVPGSLSGEYASRRGITRQLVAVLRHTIESALIDGQLLSKEELPNTRAFLRGLSETHVRAYNEEARPLDAPINKAIQAVLDAVTVWADWSEKTYARQYRERREIEGAREREERLMRRRIARIEKVLEAGPTKPPKKCKKVKHEPAPLCEKCHKRPVAKDHLCEPCLAWEKNKLGRA